MEALTPDTPVETPTPSAPAPWPSDDEILASVDETPAAETPAEEPEAEAEKPAETPVEAKPVETEEKPEESKEEDEGEFREPEPENLKRAFKAHPELKDAFYTAKAFKDVIGTVREAREYRELFPSLEDAKLAQAHAQALLNLDTLYVTDPADLLTRMYAGNPEAFDALAAQVRGVVHQLAPQTYKKEIAEPIFRDVITNFSDRAVEEGDEDLVKAIEIIRDRLGWTEKARRPTGPPDPRIAKLEQLERRQAEEAKNALVTFASHTDRAVADAIGNEIQTAFSKFPPESLPAGVRDVVTRQVLADVWRAVNANQYLTSIYNAQKSSGDTSLENMERLVASRLSQAKPFIGQKVAAMMKKITAEAVAASQKGAKQAQAAAQRKDVGAGSGSPAGTPPKKIDYRKTTDDDILSGRW